MDVNAKSSELPPFLVENYKVFLAKLHYTRSLQTFAILAKMTAGRHVPIEKLLKIKLIVVYCLPHVCLVTFRV